MTTIAKRLVQALTPIEKDLVGRWQATPQALTDQEVRALHKLRLIKNPEGESSLVASELGHDVVILLYGAKSPVA